VAFREGRKAELRKDWDTALIYYQKELRDQPENAQLLISETRARTQSSLFHLTQGRLLLSENRPDEAAGEFQRAISVDPTNQAAGQELAKVLARQAEAKRTREQTLKQALKGKTEPSQAAGVTLRPFPTESLVHFRIAGDSRKAFEALGKVAGLNIVFSKDLQSSQVAVDLTNVGIEEALRVLCFQTHTFWTALTPDTLGIIPDTPNNRRDFGPEVVKAVYLANPLTPADRTAITTALKQILGLQRVIDNPQANAIIISDAPEKTAKAEAIIHDLDRGKAEILIDVAVVEADRNRSRDLGLTPATISSSGTPSPGIQAGVVFTPPSSSSAVSLGSLTYRNYSVVLPSALANAILNDSHTHILQNPQVRVTDGDTAKLRIGSRVPYATGSFSVPGTSSSSNSTGLLANTQFQYQDVGVNLDLTPHLLLSGDVAIHAAIEISSIGSPVTIAGVSEPTFGQRKIEQDIRLKEDEVNLLGGLIQSTEVKSVNGIPGLGQLPLLRYLFSTEHSERDETEVLVMLTPRVIRLPE
jgi:general secretion pathway protein D